MAVVFTIASVVFVTVLAMATWHMVAPPPVPQTKAKPASDVQPFIDLRVFDAKGENWKAAASEMRHLHELARIKRQVDADIAMRKRRDDAYFENYKAQRDAHWAARERAWREGRP